MVAYNYSGAIKTFVVQTNGTYDITAFGGAGGANISANGAAGGSGAAIEATFDLTKGETLEIVVGHYGGNGYAGGGGGGGASLVLANTGPNGSFVPLLVAGGGGGAGSNGTSGTFAGHAATLGNAGGGSKGNGGTGYGGAGGAGVKADGGPGGSRNPPHGGYDVANGAGGGYGTLGGAGGFGGGGGASFGGGGGGGYTGGNGGPGTYSTRTHSGMGSGGFGGTSFVASSGRLISSSATHTGDGEVDIQLACYMRGTMIRTVREQAVEDVAIEALRVGDLVVTASGAHRPIRWLGHRRIDCRRHARPDTVWPVRIRAHAFGPNRPSRDLYLSPGHAVCVDIVGEVLIPAVALVDGAMIGPVEVESVEYWHVELDSHDIVMANGLPAESYLDMSNRGFFAEAGIVALNASPDADRARPGACDDARRPAKCVRDRPAAPNPRRLAAAVAG